jgi:hypothetical protein
LEGEYGTARQPRGLRSLTDREFAAFEEAAKDRERMLHAIYDAWKYLDEDQRRVGVHAHASVASAILRSQLEAAQYKPYLRRLEHKP